MKKIIKSCTHTLFLSEAGQPLKEVKFVVFLPWAFRSYVCVYVPE